MLLLAALAVGALVPLTEGSADARVIPGGRYVGKTSLGANVTVRLSRTGGGSFVVPRSSATEASAQKPTGSR